MEDLVCASSIRSPYTDAGPAHCSRSSSPLGARPTTRTPRVLPRRRFRSTKGRRSAASSSRQRARTLGSRVSCTCATAPRRWWRDSPWPISRNARSICSASSGTPTSAGTARRPRHPRRGSWGARPRAARRPLYRRSRYRDRATDGAPQQRRPCVQPVPRPWKPLERLPQRPVARQPESGREGASAGHQQRATRLRRHRQHRSRARRHLPWAMGER
jgi:hypothetical protein